MPTTYYLDGDTLLNSTTIFTDSAQTICAANGYYSDGINSREQVDCVLLPPQVCTNCSVPCDGAIAAVANQGVFLANYDLGSDTGAVIIEFSPAAVPDGIRATYNSSLYNTLSSPVDGYHKGTSADLFTYVGTVAMDCGISGTTYPTLIEYQYDGTAFQATGSTQSITVSALDVSLSVNSPGACVMVIPKIAATPTLLQLEVVGPCGSTVWGITVGCPAPLSGYSSSTTSSNSSVNACLESLETIYYNAPVTGTAGTPALHDFVFVDSNGVQALADGWYRTTSQTIQVTNGVVTNVGVCSPPVSEYIYLSSVLASCNGFCGVTNYPINLQISTTNNHSYLQVVANDVLTPPVLLDGFYAYAATSTDTSTGVYRIMQLTNNVVIALYECSGDTCSAI